MNELQRNLIGNGYGAPPSHILEGVDDAMAYRRQIGAPHTIYEEIWHLTFWQGLALDWIAGKTTPYPEHASEGFPTSTKEPWETVRARFLHQAEEMADLAGDEVKLGGTVVCQSRAPEPARTKTLREELEGEATHSAYHLGRVVLLRQMFGAWPPPSGGDTW